MFHLKQYNIFIIIILTYILYCIIIYYYLFFNTFITFRVIEFRRKKYIFIKTKYLAFFVDFVVVDRSICCGEPFDFYLKPEKKFIVDVLLISNESAKVRCNVSVLVYARAVQYIPLTIKQCSYSVSL